MGAVGVGAADGAWRDGKPFSALTIAVGKEINNVVIAMSQRIRAVSYDSDWRYEKSVVDNDVGC